MAYTKLFQKILASSIWNEDVYTKVVWITMLCMKDQNHIVQGSIGGIAHIARVSVGQAAKAIEKLEGPDPDDSSGVRDGRRLERLEHGGWLVINGAAYRDSKDEDERRAWMANYMREYRKRKQNVNNRKPPLDPVSTSDQIRTEQQKKIGANGSPPSLEDLFSELKPLYPWIDTDQEKSKIRAWVIANPGKRKLTKRFVVNWLNRVESPLSDPQSHQKPKRDSCL